METIESLHEAGYLHAAVLRGGGLISAVHVNRLLPRGRRAIQQWPSGEALDAFLQALDRRLATTDDREEQSWLRRLRSFVAKESASGVIGAVIGETVRHVAGAG